MGSSKKKSGGFASCYGGLYRPILTRLNGEILKQKSGKDELEADSLLTLPETYRNLSSYTMIFQNFIRMECREGARQGILKSSTRGRSSGHGQALTQHSIRNSMERTIQGKLRAIKTSSVSEYILEVETLDKSLMYMKHSVIALRNKSYGREFGNSYESSPWVLFVVVGIVGNGGSSQNLQLYTCSSNQNINRDFLYENLGLSAFDPLLHSKVHHFAGQKRSQAEVQAQNKERFREECQYYSAFDIEIGLLADADLCLYARMYNAALELERNSSDSATILDPLWKRILGGVQESKQVVFSDSDSDSDSEAPKKKTPEEFNKQTSEEVTSTTPEKVSAPTIKGTSATPMIRVGTSPSCSSSIVLNHSQARAVEASVSNPLTLIQGPPGTGKTRTIGEILMRHLSKGTRISSRVICSASTNKAVQNMLTKFLNLIDERKDWNPAIKRKIKSQIVLVGVDDNVKNILPNELRPYFIHTRLTDTNTDEKFECLKISAPEFCKRHVFESHADIQDNLRNADPLSLKEMQDSLETELLKSGRFFFSTLACLGRVRMTQHFLKNCKRGGKVGSFERGGTDFQEALDEFSTSDEEVQDLVDSGKALLSGGFRSQDTKPSSKGTSNSENYFPTTSASRSTNDSSLTLIIDEAGQAVEAETLIGLSLRPDRVVLVGDPQQLSAPVIHSTQCEKGGYAKSLLERLMKVYGFSQRLETVPGDLDFSVSAKPQYVLLDTQYRMHPEICSFVNERYYRGELKTCYHSSNSCSGPFDRSPFILVDHPFEEYHAGNSISNLGEAELVTKAYRLFSKNIRGSSKNDDNLSDKVIITFYQGQREAIFRSGRSGQEINAKSGHGQNCDYDRESLDFGRSAIGSRAPRMAVHTVDSFQGSEAGVVFLPFTRTRRLGFLKEFRRLNVALSRAKDHLIVFANLKKLLDCGGRSQQGSSEVLVEEEEEVIAFIKDAQRRGLVVSHLDFLDKFEGSQLVNDNGISPVKSALTVTVSPAKSTVSPAKSKSPAKLLHFRPKPGAQTPTKSPTATKSPEDSPAATNSPKEAKISPQTMKQKTERLNDSVAARATASPKDRSLCNAKRKKPAKFQQVSDEQLMQLISKSAKKRKLL